MYLLQMLADVPDAVEEDLASLMDAYQALLYTIAIGILGRGRREDAEECVADAFLAYWRNRNRHIENVQAYLAVSAKHMALNRLKLLRRREYEELTEDIPDIFSLTPEEEVMESINGEIIREVLSALAGCDGEIFLRRYFWCQSVKEIARQMGLKPKFVENRLYLAKKTIREALLRRHINL
ncbi:MAG: sigma-70 family RNA polymerase sigma factor [Clostridia bacterium]|nr:sigma-70 family RNA polymerase sigma factor [Clostridia bacterium]